MAKTFYGKKPVQQEPQIDQNQQEQAALLMQQAMAQKVMQETDKLQQGGGAPPNLENTPAPQERTPDMEQQIITEKEVRKAMQTMQDYRSAKEKLTTRLLEDEKWWQLRHWDVIRNKEKKSDGVEPTSAWLFNSLCNKHADAMDNYPEAHALPREQQDEEEAKKMSSILPCIMEIVGFEQTYNDGCWEKLKHGTAAYYDGWNPEAENGLGDIDIHLLDLLNIYWEPGISNIQDSRNLFTTALVDRDILEEQYPQFKGRFNSALVNDFKYSYDPNVKIEDKVLVVDWYYKVRSANGRTLVHYVKFAGDACILFSSENYTDEQGNRIYEDRGYYDHGKFPVVFDTLFPEKGTPVGFGLIAIMKDPQLYIDKLGGNILEHSYLCSKPRYFVADDSGINEDEFKDTSKPLIHTTLSLLDNQHLQPLSVPQISTNAVNVLQMKIDELKETSANRDFQNGGTSSGVTAAAAIAALQEAGNKVSRDMNQGGYRAYKELQDMNIELIRQFYTETRCFRITGDDGKQSFVDFDNAGIQEQQVGVSSDGTPLLRKPVFDLIIKAQKRSPFSIEAQYERAKELYAAGFFSPERAQEAMIALKMMDFDGKEQIQEEILKGQTLYNIVQQQQQIITQLTGIGLQANQQGQRSTSGGGGTTIAQSQQNATSANKTPYQKRLASNARVGGKSAND